MTSVIPKKGAKPAKAARVSGKGAAPLPNQKKRREQRAKEMIAGSGYKTRDFNNKHGNRYNTK